MRAIGTPSPAPRPRARCDCEVWNGVAEGGCAADDVEELDDGVEDWNDDVEDTGLDEDMKEDGGSVEDDAVTGRATPPETGILAKTA